MFTERDQVAWFLLVLLLGQRGRQGSVAVAARLCGSPRVWSLRPSRSGSRPGPPLSWSSGPLVCVFLQSKNAPHSQGEYDVYSTFQSHEPEFDYLKSLEIEEKINKIKWLPQQNAAHSLLSTNGEGPARAAQGPFPPRLAREQRAGPRDPDGRLLSRAGIPSGDSAVP